MISTTSELRQKIVQGLDAILQAPWLVARFISDDQRKICQAQRRFWLEADEASMAKLLQMVHAEEIMQTTHKPLGGLEEWLRYTSTI